MPASGEDPVDVRSRRRAPSPATPDASEPSLDDEALARFLDDHDLPGRGLPVRARYVTGGASNELFEIRRGDHAWALRKPPARVPPGRNETMLREFRVLSALAGTDVPHPRVHAVCEDPSVLGGCFYLMDLVDGWSPIGGRDDDATGPRRWPPPFDHDLDARRGLAYELVGGIAELSNVDWKARGLVGFGHPEGFHERQVDRWLAHFEKVRFRDVPGLDEAARWLRTHQPARYQPGIMHGDYQFANVMFRHGAPARLAAIVDWEMATVGDPLLDLGWVIQGWVDPGEEGRTGGYVDYDGMPSRAELLACYEERSGRPTDDIDYFVVLARFKLACVLEAGHARAVAGDADNPKMLAFGNVVLDLARRAADLAGRAGA